MKDPSVQNNIDRVHPGTKNSLWGKNVLQVRMAQLVAFPGAVSGFVIIL